jgi:hypothetical protein
VVLAFYNNILSNMAIEMSETLYSSLVCVVVPAFYEKYRNF